MKSIGLISGTMTSSGDISSPLEGAIDLDAIILWAPVIRPPPPPPWRWWLNSAEHDRGMLADRVLWISSWDRSNVSLKKPPTNETVSVFLIPDFELELITKTVSLPQYVGLISIRSSPLVSMCLAGVGGALFIQEVGFVGNVTCCCFGVDDLKMFLSRPLLKYVAPLLSNTDETLPFVTSILLLLLILILLLLMFNRLLLDALLSDTDAWWQHEDGDEFVSMASCFKTNVAGAVDFDESFACCWFWWCWGCDVLVLQTKEVTATGETKDWWVGLVELFPVELFRIRRPPPPWIWDKLRTSGGVDVVAGLAELLLGELWLLLWWWECCCCCWEWWECTEIPSREWRRVTWLALLEAAATIMLPEPVVEETCKWKVTYEWTHAIKCKNL